MSVVIEKYLRDHIDPRASLENQRMAGETFDTAVVVPAYNESAFLSTLLESLEKAACRSKLRPLVILVVNHKTTTPETDKTRNLRLLDTLKDFYSASLSLLPLDFVSPGREFGPKEGVGHARKIGADFALSLFQQRQIRSPFFHTTDGDAVVGEDYFVIDWTDGLAAQVADYRHTPSGDPILDHAHELYEYSLRYYEENLALAGSPYAFPTIGSLLTISFEHYAMVRGFPKRLAAEDFYILNKLAKVGTVEKRTQAVSLRARTSDRVPFGTGQGVAQILAGGIDRFTVYDPRVFENLKHVLKTLRQFPEHRSIERSRRELNVYPVEGVLQAIGFWEQLDTANKTRPSNTDCLRHLVHYFDAFITLKFVHGMRDSVYPDRKPDLPISMRLEQGLAQ